jgi:hypothetical protein
MHDNSAKPRNFNSMSVPGLSDEARQAVNAAFDAMSAWRIDTANEKNSEQLIEKMPEAARALGWPEQIVDVTRVQLQSIAKMQIQMMDHMMWMFGGANQITKPDDRPVGDAIEAKIPAGVPAGTWPNADALAATAMNPMQFWVQWGNAQIN